MNKVEFVKSFKLSSRLEQIMIRVEGENDIEYEQRVKLARYGIEGEDRVNYQLINSDLPLVCLSDVRIQEEFGSAQADFIIISKNKVFIVEVKNLYGSVKVTNDKELIRVIPRLTHIEEEGIGNPFVQVERQCKIFKRLFDDNDFSFNIEPLIVMGNPRTAVIFLGNKYPIIRYDGIKRYLEERVAIDITQDDYNIMKKLGLFLVDRNKEKTFNDFNMIKKRMRGIIQKNNYYEGEDLELYKELVEERKKISKLKDIPICNVFTNVDLDNLIYYKPITENEMVEIPGIKYKKFLIFGNEVIEIIKRYVKN